MADNVNAGPSAAEIFAAYFKKSRSVIGTLNPNISFQLQEETNKETENSDDSGVLPTK